MDQLKKLVADLSLDKVMLQNIAEKNGERGDAARSLQSHFRVSERRACRVIRLSRAVCRYVSVRPPQDALRRAPGQQKQRDDGRRYEVTTVRHCDVSAFAKRQLFH